MAEYEAVLPLEGPGVSGGWKEVKSWCLEAFSSHGVSKQQINRSAQAGLVTIDGFRPARGEHIIIQPGATVQLKLVSGGAPDAEVLSLVVTSDEAGSRLGKYAIQVPKPYQHPNYGS